MSGKAVLIGALAGLAFVSGTLWYLHQQYGQKEALKVAVPREKTAVAPKTRPAQPKAEPQSAPSAAEPAEKADMSLVGTRVFSKRYYPLGTVSQVLKDGKIHVLSRGPLIQGTRAVEKGEYARSAYIRKYAVILTLTRGEFRERPDIGEKK